MRRALPLLLPLALIACSSPTPPSTAPASPVQDAASLPGAAAADHSATLGAYHWRLVDARDGAGARIEALLAEGGAPLQLDFSDGGVSVSNACNRIAGNVTLDADRIGIDQVISTLMACNDPRLTALERAIVERLPGAHRLTITPGEAPQLALQTGAGDVLRFDGMPTPATRYGSDGEQLFLEIAAERVACTHPLIDGHRCLQVRPVVYDASGIRQPSAAEWTPLYQEIEGFTHEDGVRSVVRVRRFDVSDPPAGAPSQAWVLDMVVESEDTRR